METNIAKTFKDTRLKLGLSQEDMAALLGINRVTLSMYETGAIEAPGSDKLIKLMNLISDNNCKG